MQAVRIGLNYIGSHQTIIRQIYLILRIILAVLLHVFKIFRLKLLIIFFLVRLILVILLVVFIPNFFVLVILNVIFCQLRGKFGNGFSVSFQLRFVLRISFISRILNNFGSGLNCVVSCFFKVVLCLSRVISCHFVIVIFPSSIIFFIGTIICYVGLYGSGCSRCYRFRGGNIFGRNEKFWSFFTGSFNVRRSRLEFAWIIRGSRFNRCSRFNQNSPSTTDKCRVVKTVNLVEVYKNVFECVRAYSKTRRVSVAVLDVGGSDAV